MITYLIHEKIDKTRWDDCVAHAVNGVVYAWSWYLDEVHPGWEALVEVDGDNYKSIMPLTCKKKYGINYLCKPFFVQQLGVFSRMPLTAETVRAFLSSIPRRFRLVEIRLNENNPVNPPLKGVVPHRNHLLDLSRNYNDLLSGYNENTKRNLKKSLKCGLQFMEGVSAREVIRLFRNDRGSTINHWGDAEYARLASLTDIALASSNAFVYGIKTSDNDDIICGAILMYSHHRLTFLFSGNSSRGKEVQAMTFLLDQVIQKFSGQSIVLDFEGSDDDDLARFYHGFGGVPVTYPSFSFRLRNPLQ